MTASRLNRLKTWLDAGLGFFYPPACQICGRERAEVQEGFVCEPCWSRDGGLRFIEPPFCACCGLPHEGAISTTYVCANCSDLTLHFSTARAAVRAQGLTLEIIHRYKYHRALWFEPLLANLLHRQAVPWLQGKPWNLIVPVPLHPVKEREREFNQAQRLAVRLGKATGLPVECSALVRIQPTRTQTALSREDRTRNVHHAFALRDPSRIRNAHVVLVDDVMTTGATASACAATLRAAGASDVCVWTVARAVFQPQLASLPG